MPDDEGATPAQNRSMRMLRVVQHVLFTAMVVLGAARSAFDDGATAAEVVVGGALLAWYWEGSEAARRWRRPSQRTWLAVLSGLCLAAVWVSADFAWVSFAVFVTFATTLAPAPAVAAIVTMAAGTGAILVGRWPDGGHWAAQIVGPLVGAAAAGALVGVGRVASAETAERQRLLDELLATRDDLARANLAAGAREERERLTGEIHDTLAQGFTSVVMAARRARRALADDDGAATAAEVDHIEELGRTGIDAARRNAQHRLRAGPGLDHQRDDPAATRTGNSTMIRIVIVDDHPVVRAGLRTVLDAADDIVVVGEAHDHDTAVVAIADLEPDVVVLDVHLGTGPSGLDVLRQVQRSQARPRVLVVTVFDNDIDIDAALEGGAAGYVLKDAPEVDLISAVRAVAAGHQPLDPRVVARVVTRSRRNSDIPSPRELEVLAAVADGHDNATIARDLYISQATVKSHLASVFAKLGVATRTGAVAEARRRGHLR